MNDFIPWMLIVANILVAVGFLLACATVSKAPFPAYLWQTVVLRICAILLYAGVAYDFLRQSYFIYASEDYVQTTVSWHYILVRALLVISMPTALWISWHIRSVRNVNPAVESYVERLIREAEEEEAARQRAISRDVVREHMVEQHTDDSPSAPVVQ
jgi:hypothetical protein